MLYTVSKFPYISFYRDDPVRVLRFLELGLARKKWPGVARRERRPINERTYHTYIFTFRS